MTRPKFFLFSSLLCVILAVCYPFYINSMHYTLNVRVTPYEEEAKEFFAANQESLANLVALKERFPAPVFDTYCTPTHSYTIPQEATTIISALGTDYSFELSRHEIAILIASDTRFEIYLAHNDDNNYCYGLDPGLTNVTVLENGWKIHSAYIIPM